MKQVTVFAVATFGGQIIDFQEPIKKENKHERGTIRVFRKKRLYLG